MAIPRSLDSRLASSRLFPRLRRSCDMKYIECQGQIKRNVGYLPADNAGTVRNSSVLDNFLQVWQIILKAPDLVQLLLVLHHQNVAPAVFEDVLAGIRSIGGINSSGKSSSKYGSHIRYNPLRGVEAEDADRAVFLEAEINEGLGHGPRLLVIGGPSPHRLQCVNVSYYIV